MHEMKKLALPSRTHSNWTEMVNSKSNLILIKCSAMEFICDTWGYHGSAFIVVTVQSVPLLFWFPGPLSPRFTGFSCAVLVLVVLST
jgi:hypothetical protein